LSRVLMSPSIAHDYGNRPESPQIRQRVQVLVNATDRPPVFDHLVIDLIAIHGAAQVRCEEGRHLSKPTRFASEKGGIGPKCNDIATLSAFPNIILGGLKVIEPFGKGKVSR
jgi:hypothetical protein